VECGVICVKDLKVECMCVIKEVVFKIGNMCVRCGCKVLSSARCICNSGWCYIHAKF
jgi:hypothetical protein